MTTRKKKPKPLGRVKSIRRTRKGLLAKIETTYGKDPAPAGFEPLLRSLGYKPMETKKSVRFAPKTGRPKIAYTFAFCCPNCGVPIRLDGEQPL
jgi:hypothetical protein